MLTFSENFFSGETRNDFYIEPMMKRAWAAQLEVLDVIEQICNKHGLRYFADWGTLLGAVRHKGFIPWDDDIDICMMREDYDKLLSVAGTELPGEYRVYDMNTDPEWDQAFARITNADTVSYSEERLSKFHGCPYAVGIDVFPLDVLPEDPQTESYFTELFSTLYSAAHLSVTDPVGTAEVLPDLEELCNRKIDRNKNIQNQLLQAAEAVGKSYLNSGAPMVANLALHALRKRALRKEWYRGCIYLPFEQVKLPVPVDYDAVLTVQFGDYMIPVRYNDHAYPFYKKQQESYEKSLS